MSTGTVLIIEQDSNDKKFTVGVELLREQLKDLMDSNIQTDSKDGLADMLGDMLIHAEERPGVPLLVHFTEWEDTDG